jgi:hypothetical protein
MNIRNKIIWVVVPLLIAALVLAGASSYFSAANGITRIAREFFGFKLFELQKYADNQWALLLENGYAERPEMVNAAEKAVEIYARSIILSESELIFALDSNGAPVMSTSQTDISPAEGAALIALFEENDQELVTAAAGGKDRVIRAF